MSGGDTVPATEHDVAPRLNRLWHALFAGTLVVPTLVVLADGARPPSQRLFTAALAASFAAWYGTTLGRHPRWRERIALTVIYWCGGAAFTVLLVGREEAYVILLYGQFPLMFLTLGWWALVPTAVLTAAVGWLLGAWSGGADGVLNLLTTTALAWVIAVVIDAVERQSERRRAALEALERTRAQLVATARHAGVLEERQRLAREIHDTVAQGLASIVTQAEAAEEALDDRPADVRRHLSTVRETARAGLTEVRRSVRNLRPDLIDGVPLVEALRAQCRGWSAGTGVLAEVRVTGTAVPLPVETETALLRIAQEALTNIGKHARARRATVTVSYLGDTVALDIDDDGAGFPATGPLPPGPDGGFGLTGMRERVAAVGGRLEVESAPGAGTTIAVSVPA